MNYGQYLPFLLLKEDIESCVTSGMGARRHFDTSVPVEVSKWRFQFAGKSADRKRFVLCEEEWDSPVPKGARVFEVRAVVNL